MIKICLWCNVVSKDNQNFFYEWHIEKGTEKIVIMLVTSAVSYPQVKGQNIKCHLLHHGKKRLIS